LESDLSELVQKRPDIIPLLEHYHGDVMFNKGDNVHLITYKLNKVISQHFLGTDQPWDVHWNKPTSYTKFKQTQFEKERAYIKSLVDSMKVSKFEELKKAVTYGHQTVAKTLHEIFGYFDFKPSEDPCMVCNEKCRGYLSVVRLPMCDQCFFQLATGQFYSKMKQFLMDYFYRDHGSNIFWNYGFLLPEKETLRWAKMESKKGLLACPLCNVDLLAPPEELIRYEPDKVIFNYTVDRSVFICTKCHHRENGGERVRKDERFNAFILSFWDQLLNNGSVVFLSKEAAIVKMKESFEKAIFWPVHNKTMTREAAIAGYSDFFRWQILGMEPKESNDETRPLTESNGEMEV